MQGICFHRPKRDSRLPSQQALSFLYMQCLRVVIEGERQRMRKRTYRKHNKLTGYREASTEILQ